MENFQIVTRRDLSRQENANFSRRHLATSLDEAFDKASFRRHIRLQSFFMSELSTQFYVLPDGFIVSKYPLTMFDVTCYNHRPIVGTYAIWKDDHFDRNLWICFNYHHMGIPLTDKIKQFRECHKCKRRQ